jgi:hypothetical protein
LRAESCQPLQFLSSQIGHIPSNWTMRWPRRPAR